MVSWNLQSISVIRRWPLELRELVGTDYNLNVSCLFQLYGGSQSATESWRFFDEEGAELLCKGVGKPRATLSGHPGRV